MPINVDVINNEVGSRPNLVSSTFQITEIIKSPGKADEEVQRTYPLALASQVPAMIIAADSSNRSPVILFNKVGNSEEYVVNVSPKMVQRDPGLPSSTPEQTSIAIQTMPHNHLGT